MKRMLINATQQEELRMAMVDGQRLYDLNIEGPASERKKANIYKGKITRVEPSLEAAFVDYGAERHGFLPLKEVSSEYFVKAPKGGGKPNIREVLKEGQDIVVQIDKEERGTKGAALTTFVSLAGRFIVLKPNKAKSGGVSRRIVGSDRDLARRSLNAIEVPDGMSVILRTAGIDRTPEELKWDLDNLMAVWHAFFHTKVIDRPSPFLIYRESNSVIRALRDYLTNEIGEILIDDDATHKEALEFVEQVMPHNARKLKLYEDPVPLFTRFQIETQIESAFSHSVTLPSGGSVVIDHTEALVSIDINSARATKGGDIEATALNTNLEAADEIARQLRIRDLGGLVVIDFIDMGPQKNQRDVENRLREAVRQDRARVQIGKISRFGLLEMSRQRLRPSLGESSYLVCPRCSGIGTIRSVESLALAILRIIGEEARKERTAKVIAQLPVEVATFLLNEKRDWVQNLESDNKVQVVLVANSALETPHYDIRRVRDDQTDLPENLGASYELAEAEAEQIIPQSIQELPPAETAAVATMKPSTPAPKRQVREEPTEPAKGFFASVAALFAGLFAGDAASDQPVKKKSGQRKKTAKGRPQRDGGRSRGRERGRSSRSGDSRRGGKKTHSDQSADNKQGKGKKRSRKEAKPADGERKSASQQTPKDQSQKSGDEQSSSRSSRNRRSRGGRRRRRSQDKPAAQTSAEQSSSSAPKTNDTKPAEQKPAASPKPKDATPKPAKNTAGGEAGKPRRSKSEDTQVADNKGSDNKQPDSKRPDDKGSQAATSSDGRKADAAPPQAKTESNDKTARKPEAQTGDKPKADAVKGADAKPEKRSASGDGGTSGKPADSRKTNGADKAESPRSTERAAKPAAKSGGDKPQSTAPLLPWAPSAPAETKAPPAKPKEQAKPVAERKTDTASQDKQSDTAPKAPARETSADKSADAPASDG